MAKEPRSCPCKFLSTSLSSFTAAEYGDIHSLSKINDVATRKDDAGYNPLHFTAQFNHVAATALLLQLGCDVDGSGHCGATPLHRAAFSGATAAMKVLLEWKTPGIDYPQTIAIDAEVTCSENATASNTHTSAMSSKEKRCDLLARDTSFQDEFTPLHKAAAGGRYLAVHIILEALKDRDIVLANGSKSTTVDILPSPKTSWLQRGLLARERHGRTPLDVARHFFRIQDTERDAVARWDEVAGGVADWGKCVRLLENAVAASACKNRGRESTRGNEQTGNHSSSSRDIPRLPLHLRKGVMACLDCTAVPGKIGTVCLFSNWQASFQEALGNSARLCIVACTAANPEPNVVAPASCPNVVKSTVATKENNSARKETHTSKKKFITRHSTCNRCKKPTIVFYQLPGVGTLVCKSCKRLAR